MDKKWKVYVHINKTNGKRYVGVTSRKDANVRWKDGNGYIENPHFYSAITKYGWDGFDHIIIADNLDEKIAKQMERDLIKKWHANDRLYGYNMTSGGDGTPDYHPSEETRAKLSFARRRENLSEETLRRRSEGLKGRKFSEEHRRKIGDGNSKPIIMCDKSGNELRRFRSARQAEVTFNVSHTHISQCCHGRRMSAGGYIWKFA